jgi:hypothetical protein
MLEREVHGAGVAQLVLQRTYGSDDQGIEVPLPAAAFLSSLQRPDGLRFTQLPTQRLVKQPRE